jgi:hypothetical protein
MSINLIGQERHIKTIVRRSLSFGDPNENKHDMHSWNIHNAPEIGPE